MKILCSITISLLMLFGSATTALSSLGDVEVAILEENFQQAKRLAQEALQSNPRLEVANELQYYLALSELRLGEISSARQSFQELTQKRLTPKLRDKALLGLNEVYYLQEKYQEALNIAEKLLGENPKSEFLSLIYLKIARANLKLAKWTEAKNYLKKIMKEFPESYEAHLAQQLLEEKQYFSVQVGAFLDRQRAEETLVELKEKAGYAYIVETIDHKQTKFYRVRVGQLASLDEAHELEEQLSNQGFPTQIYP